VSLAISSITLAGAPVPLNDVLASVTIRHGRVDAGDAPTASSAQLMFLDIDRAFARAFRTGAQLVVNARDGGGAEAPRFTGRITDGSLDVDDLSAIAIGRLSTLNDHVIGGVDWPAETWSARVTRAFTDAGLAALLELVPAVFNPQLAARLTVDGGPVGLLDYLGTLAAMVGAAIVDRPNGNILVQALGARSLAGMVTLDPAEVEYAPAWTQILPEANHVTVKWAGGADVIVQDADSIALYGPRPETIDTTFTVLLDAQTRANSRLATAAFPHWNIPNAPLLVGHNYAIGSPLKLVAMPPASPYSPWTPVLEGWTDTIDVAGDELNWHMQLALSDPLASGLTLPWSAVPVADKWNTINQTVAWRDALTLGDLESV
jgi:hypothetical protein